jgi:hypothetical protein
MTMSALATGLSAHVGFGGFCTTGHDGPATTRPVTENSWLGLVVRLLIQLAHVAIVNTTNALRFHIRITASFDCFRT